MGLGSQVGSNLTTRIKQTAEKKKGVAALFIDHSIVIDTPLPLTGLRDTQSSDAALA